MEAWESENYQCKPRCRSAAPLGVGTKALLTARPEDIALVDSAAAAPPHDANVLKGKIVNRVFLGEVVDGSDVVDRISQTQTGRNDRPAQDVVLESVSIEEAAG